MEERKNINMDEKKVREAIEGFQEQVDWLKRIDDKCCEEARRCCIEYFETAIEALKKQLSKKPNTTEDKQFALCPCCNSRGLLNQQKYCDNCGQKIDWLGKINENRRI